jgi:hypothetical protein
MSSPIHDRGGNIRITCFIFPNHFKGEIRPSEYPLCCISPPTFCQFPADKDENKKINAILLEHKKKFGETSTFFEYQFEKGGPKFIIVAILNGKYDPNAKKDKGNNPYHLFATNLTVDNASDILKKIPEEYRKRWNIETVYRVKNAFKIRTCYKSPVARSLFFLIQCLLFNIESLLKSVIEIDAYKLKSAISDAIEIVLKEGYKLLCDVTVENFMTSMWKYMENRTKDLRDRLRVN